MSNALSSLADLSDDKVIARVSQLAERERHASADLIASLSEMDARRLYLGQGCSSLFTYCTQVLRLSEHAAYRRIEAARAARRFPILLDLLEAGSINLTTLGLLTVHLTEANHREVLQSATHKSKRDVEQLVASLHPRAPIPSIIRKLPAPRPLRSPHTTAAAESETTAIVPLVQNDDRGVVAGPRTEPARRAPIVAPLAADLYKLQLTLTRETHNKLRQAQDLLRHTIPNGDPAAILDRALTLLLTTLERTRLGAAARPRATRSSPDQKSRSIPASVRRQVWARDGGQCAFVGEAGRCTERGFLEFHHVVPFAAGGTATVHNIQLRCRAHNASESELFFGPLIARERAADYTNSFRNELSGGDASAQRLRVTGRRGGEGFLQDRFQQPVTLDSRNLELCL